MRYLCIFSPTYIALTVFNSYLCMNQSFYAILRNPIFKRQSQPIIFPRVQGVCALFFKHRPRPAHQRWRCRRAAHLETPVKPERPSVAAAVRPTPRNETAGRRAPLRKPQVTPLPEAELPTHRAPRIYAAPTCDNGSILGDWRSGSAAPLHGEGRGFKSLIAHHSKHQVDCLKSHLLAPLRSTSYALLARLYVG